MANVTSESYLIVVEKTAKNLSAFSPDLPENAKAFIARYVERSTNDVIDAWRSDNPLPGEFVLSCWLPEAGSMCFIRFEFISPSFKFRFRTGDWFPEGSGTPQVHAHVGRTVRLETSGCRLVRPSRGLGTIQRGRSSAKHAITT